MLLAPLERSTPVPTVPLAPARPPLPVLVMEYAAGGDLFKYVSLHRGLSEDDARWFFQQIIFAIDYCERCPTAATLPCTLLASLRWAAVLCQHSRCWRWVRVAPSYG